MSFYTFLVAQLPQLSLDLRAPYTVSGFVEYVSEWLSEQEQTVLRAILNNEPSDDPVVQDYRLYDESLRNQLALLRGVKLNRDAGHFVRSGEKPDHQTRHILSECVKDENPEHAEKQLDKLRWQFIEYRTSLDYFNFSFLVGYLLKLKLVERWSTLDEKVGKELLQSALQEGTGETQGTPS
jgi:hypothetical protein